MIELSEPKVSMHCAIRSHRVLTHLPFSDCVSLRSPRLTGHGGALPTARLVTGVVSGVLALRERDSVGDLSIPV